MFNIILVTFNFLLKKMPVNVEIKCSLRDKFESLQCPPNPQLRSGTTSTKITLTSNTGQGHNFLVHGNKRITFFNADVKGGS